MCHNVSAAMENHKKTYDSRISRISRYFQVTYMRVFLDTNQNFDATFLGHMGPPYVQYSSTVSFHTRTAVHVEYTWFQVIWVSVRSLAAQIPALLNFTSDSVGDRGTKGKPFQSIERGKNVTWHTYLRAINAEMLRLTLGENVPGIAVEFDFFVIDGNGEVLDQNSVKHTSKVLVGRLLDARGVTFLPYPDNPVPLFEYEFLE
ncbi:hypothetical protein K435DRAFT_790004 [Dendrothele bispora CBS 962.96]|uniref:Uncharacterized protein n=1 Tax=Dendrothele bispora (strain CBS 962.96) TaxID=1314807 RepID=A0A4S8MRL8_DENBC|nr:hypothetical protein K435DRAFT_790004 [Dendrothele bispora CBS 962.96]